MKILFLVIVLLVCSCGSKNDNIAPMNNTAIITYTLKSDNSNTTAVVRHHIKDNLVIDYIYTVKSELTVKDTIPLNFRSYVKMETSNKPIGNFEIIISDGEKVLIDKKEFSIDDSGKYYIELKDTLLF
ncbi:hypothetical protein [Mucilaginibacter lappiensis]|uniref:Lipoprotein n=1 Tax=Mucilaginibacter lappiensis TaxID=354630 RepID=A0A841JFS3_9SPHI|nr:hypothetical protein [Mucilaginibacter lappiensis]MBB6126901.1 hypothetical protein [Mucilaginibacter lappiensis]